jgi:hypothetical protein
MSLALTDETGNSIAFDQLVKHKENIQPLKQGRSVAQLHQILDIAENKQTGLSVCTEGMFITFHLDFFFSHFPYFIVISPIILILTPSPRTYPPTN